ncbi:MAG: hypothetical protein MUO39_07470 [Steroidobacteraceae bacterium]|nr:hypothetical protein [Steroidobacteraceae bacterium]
MSDPGEQRAAIERALMDRARALAAHQPERPRRLLQHSVALVAAIVIVGVVLFGFNAFLVAMQRYMDTEVVEPAPAATDPMPAYAVQPDVSLPPPADQDPRPSQAPAQETSPAIP